MAIAMPGCNPEMPALRERRGQLIGAQRGLAQLFDNLLDWQQ